MTENTQEINQLVPVTARWVGEQEVNTVNARELHEYLEVKSPFNNWITNRIRDGKFAEGKDYLIIHNPPKPGARGRPPRDYIVSLKMAKYLCMIERGPKGDELRDYFLECESQQSQALKGLSLLRYAHPSNLIFSLAGEVYTTSLLLAEVSGKSHRDVLKDIKEEIQALKEDTKLDSMLAEDLLKGFKEASHKDSRGDFEMYYQMSQEAFLQVSSRYPSGVRAMFVLAFAEYRKTVVNMYKARILEKVMPQVLTSRSFVYIIREEGGGRLKVGVSNNPEKRLKTLQTGNPETLSLLYTSLVCSNSLEIETKTHKHFEEYLVRGEWFNPELSLERIIKYLESQTYVLESDFDLSFDSQIFNFLDKKFQQTAGVPYATQ